MINITFSDWEKACNFVSDYAFRYGEFYLQLYPFKNYSINSLSSKDFFDKYVDTGLILTDYNNMEKIDNYCRKSDGSFRKRKLISPIIYLYYIAIGVYIERKYKSNRNPNISVYYAGNFNTGKLHYKENYDYFVSEIYKNIDDYNYYCKIDIANFFDSIDLKILNQNISSRTSFNNLEQKFLADFLTFCGDKESLPQLECGVTSSFLSTVIYLDDIDCKLYSMLSKFSDIKNYKIIRYVDDLYILLKVDGRKNLKAIENKIFQYYESLIFDKKISINKNKSSLNKIENIRNDLKTFSLYDSIISDLKIHDFWKDEFVCFLNELIKVAEKESLNYKDYNVLIEKFSEKEDVSGYQILYAIVYRKMEWISGNKVIRRLEKVIEKDFDIIGLDPRRLVCLILNTKDEGLIKKLLFKLYQSSEKNQWDISKNYIAIQYLLYRNFVATKLLNCIEHYSPEIVRFIKRFYKNDWTKTCINDNSKILVNYLDSSKNAIKLLSFFKFNEIISFEYKKVLEFQSFNKSYFDMITNMFCLTIGIDTKKIFYNKDKLTDIYINNLCISNEKFVLISNLCDKRNENPLCHATTKILSSKKNNTTKILMEVKEINILVDELIKEFL